ncbi:leucine-rich repeat-containing protein 19 isoform X2 [Dipodomys spectabilis]|uniref:leucine-rich repeat-containing protein 19 isoform X2 n=1 Tax=Dipodomys spectabilis TaxID=105255 RepID=UPI001C53F81C|nr:leucine-rich repeat-containing protein 19 isoform X2 [Dipodomys spectabilis]
MKIRYMMILFWPISVLLSDKSQTSKTEVKYNFTEKNYTLIPADISNNVSILDLSYNQITLNLTDIKVLQMYLLLIELYLNQNSISILHNNSFINLSSLQILHICRNSINVIQKDAFMGLNKLKELYLCQNKILQLNPEVFVPLSNLKVLNLQDNLMNYFDRPQLLHLELIILYRNPWNCTCRLFNLQNWLNTSNVILEHEPLGKSWAFLVGVVVTVLVTSLLILLAVKCPVWYKFLLSYNHHRLEEREVETCEDGFSGNTNSPSQIPHINSDDTIVIFEQLHSFAIDDDGFIEDKYIDTHELCEQK